MIEKLTVLFLCVFFLFVGWGAKSCTTPSPLRPIVRVDTLDRVITRRDTIRPPAQIVERIVFRAGPVRVDTVVQYIPRGFTPTGVIGPTPIRVFPGSVTLTWVDPTTGRFIIDRFEVRRKWGYAITTGAGVFYEPLTSTRRPALWIRGTLRYKRLSFVLQPLIVQGVSVYAGLELRVAGKL